MEAPHSGYRDDYPGTQHRISPNHPRMQRHGGGRGEACLDKAPTKSRILHWQRQLSFALMRPVVPEDVPGVLGKDGSMAGCGDKHAQLGPCTQLSEHRFGS